MMQFLGKAAPLDLEGLRAAADRVQVEALALWTLIGVETSGCGFLPDGRPKILFERHVFSRRTDGRFDDSHPDISNPQPGGYGAPGAAQYERLQAAQALDATAAIESASWGIGQVMGYQAAGLGYADTATMVQGMCDSEALQLDAVARFLEVNRAVPALRDGLWDQVARIYNGPGYAINHYDTRLAAGYAALQVSGLPDFRIRTAQVWLGFTGHDPHGIDGIMGRMTLAAWNDFQRGQQLPTTTSVDDASFAALGQAAAQALGC